LKKNEYWRTRVFRDGENRYIEGVIRPALADLAQARQHLLDQMPEERSGDEETVALFQAEIARMDSFEARLNQHLKQTRDRFARLMKSR
jgi:hypothetical protein